VLLLLLLLLLLVRAPLLLKPHLDRGKHRRQ
jgi:hypothetical protein